MGKRKPDSVRELRISLQDKLSSQVDSYTSAQAALSWAEAIDKIASFENLYVIVTVVEVVTGKEILPGTPNDIYEIIDALREFDLSNLVRTGLTEFGQINSLLLDFFNPFSPGLETSSSTGIPSQSPGGGPAAVGGRNDLNRDGLHDITGEPIAGRFRG